MKYRRCGRVRGFWQWKLSRKQNEKGDARTERRRNCFDVIHNVFFFRFLGGRLSLRLVIIVGVVCPLMWFTVITTIETDYVHCGWCPKGETFRTTTSPPRPDTRPPTAAARLRGSAVTKGLEWTPHGQKPQNARSYRTRRAVPSPITAVVGPPSPSEFYRTKIDRDFILHSPPSLFHIRSTQY